MHRYDLLRSTLDERNCQFMRNCRYLCRITLTVNNEEQFDEGLVRFLLENKYLGFLNGVRFTDLVQRYSPSMGKELKRHETIVKNQLQ